MARSQAQHKNGNGSGGASPFSVIRQAASALVSRLDFSNRAGVTYGGKRDVYGVLGYPCNLRVQDYRSRYQRGGIAKRLLNIYPRSTWVSGVQIIDDADPEVETEFERQVKELFTRLEVWKKLRIADRLASMGHYGAILIGAPGDLDTPMPQVQGADQIIYLTPLAEDRAEVIELDMDHESERFGLPLFYHVTLGSPLGTKNKAVSTLARTVHWSRIIHVVEEPEEDEIFGVPRLRAVWNYLEDLDKLVGGGSEAAWRRMDPGMNLEIDPDKFVGDGPIDPKVLEKMEDQADEYFHGLRRMVKTVGGKLTPLTAGVTMFGPNAAAIIDLVCGTDGVPQRILLGSERGELASSQDRRNWNDRISERWDDFSTPLTRQLIDRLIEHNALPRPQQDSYEVVWPELETMDESEKAEIAGNLASANKSQFDAEGTVIIRAEEIRDRVFGLEPLADTGGEEPEPPEESDEEEGNAEARGAQDADLADEDPDEPEWAAIHRVGDSHRGTVMGLFLASWLSVSGSVDAEALDRAMALGNQALSTGIIMEAYGAAESQLESEVREELRATLVGGAEATLAAARRRGSLLRTAQSVFEVEFDATDPAAVHWIEQHTGELIREVGSATRETIRILVARAFEQGIPPRRLVSELRELVGLRSDQLRARDRFRERLSDRGVGGDILDRRVARYAEKLRRDRALLIARTETIRAANEGQRQLWSQAQASGELSKEARRVWIVTPDDRLCPVCSDLEGAITDINGEFPGAGSGPPAHPACRCATGIATDREVERARQAEADQRVLAQPSSSYDQLNRGEYETMSQFRRADGTFTPGRAKLHDAIERKVLRDVTAVESPEVTVLGGGPSSGKSSVVRQILGKDARGGVSNTVTVDVDEIRGLLPEMREGIARGATDAAMITHEESSLLAKRIVRKALDSRFNVVVDGTGDGSVTKMLSKVEGYRESGARVVGQYASLDTDLAVRLMVKRGQRTGRFVPEGYMRETHAGVSQTLPELMQRGTFDDVKLWDTNIQGKPRLVASASRSGEITIHDQKLWDDFLAKAQQGGGG